MTGARPREEIEQEAERFLATVDPWIWDGSRLPIPVEDIADSCCGLRIRDVEPEALCEVPGLPAHVDGHGLSGVLVPSIGEIWINANEEYEPRRRFTICHEIGHWLLHMKGQTSFSAARPLSSRTMRLRTWSARPFPRLKRRRTISPPRF